MRALWIAVVALGGCLALGYAVGLGIYSVSSTRPEVAAQPRNAAEARQVIRALGLEAEYPFEHGFVQTPHGRMHYGQAGQGDPVDRRSR